MKKNNQQAKENKGSKADRTLNGKYQNVFPLNEKELASFKWRIPLYPGIYRNAVWLYTTFQREAVSRPRCYTIPTAGLTQDQNKKKTPGSRLDRSYDM